MLRNILPLTLITTIFTGCDKPTWDAMEICPSEPCLNTSDCPVDHVCGVAGCVVPGTSGQLCSTIGDSVPPVVPLPTGLWECIAIAEQCVDNAGFPSCGEQACPSDACQDATDCPSGHACEDSKCVRPCVSSADCPSTLSCIDPLGTAGICVDEKGNPWQVCEPGNAAAYQVCISDYETCSYQYPEAHEPACQLDYVWCQMEHCSSAAEYLAYCAEVYQTCPGG